MFREAGSDLHNMKSGTVNLGSLLYGRLAPLVLFAICLGSLNVDIYFVSIRLREIAIALNVALLTFHLVVSPVPFGTTLRIAIAPLVAILIAMTTWALVFRENTGRDFLPSFLAMRFWLLYLIAPNLYFAYRLGIGFQHLAKVILAAITVMCLIAAIAYATLPLAQYAFSPDPDVRNLVRVDDLRGIRLVVPFYALTFGVTYVCFTFLRLPLRFSWLDVVLLPLAFFHWISFLSRALVTAFLAAFVIYHLTLSRKGQLTPMKLLAAGVGVVFTAVLFSLSDAAISALNRDTSYIIRHRAVEIALRQINYHPILGFGQASNYSLSYQQMYGPNFAPSDIGLIGITFQYGLVGAILYIGIAVLVAYLAVGAYRVANDSFSVLISKTLLVWTLTMLLASISFPAFTTGEGVTMTACVIGLAMMIRDDARAKRTRKDVSR